MPCSWYEIGQFQTKDGITNPSFLLLIINFWIFSERLTLLMI